MSAGKHTPGPWSLIDSGRGWIVTGNDGLYDIAVVRNIGNEENYSNARLIAAAPELLETLNSCVSELELFANTHHPKGADGARDHLVKIMHARAAIAKATGATE